MTWLGRVIFLTLVLGRAPAIAGGATRAVDLDHVKVVNSGSDPVPVIGGVQGEPKRGVEGCIDGTLSVKCDDPVTFFLGSYYVSTDTYRGLPVGLVACRTDHFTIGLVLTQLPAPGCSELGRVKSTA
jgi:hypothetical protein